MGYLICEKCGGYYELQEGESINDFEGCSCGGKFRLVENLEEFYKEQQNASDEKPVVKEKKITNSKSDSDKLKKRISICSKCNEENPEGALFCQNCGKKLKINNQENKLKVDSSKKGSVLIVLGAFFFFGLFAMLLFIIYFFTTDSNIRSISSYALIVIFFISPVLAGFIFGETYKKGLLAGFLVGISLILLEISVAASYTGYFLNIFYNLNYFSILILTIFDLFLGISGVLIGIWLQNRIQHKINSIKFISIFKNWWNKKSSISIFGIGIVGIFCLLLLVNLGAWAAAPHPYGNDTGTYYSSEYLSFSHDYFKNETFGNKLRGDYFIVAGNFTNGDSFTVQKPEDTNKTAYEAVIKHKNVLDDRSLGGYSEYTIEPIQIANVTGYKIDALTYFHGTKSHLIIIYFDKNGKLYQINFDSDERDTINQNKESMDKILNSITVT